MKRFEIGDGEKSILVPRRWVAEQEDDETVLLYDPLAKNVELRVSVLSLKAESQDIEEPGREWLVQKARDLGLSAVTTEDMAYITYKEKPEITGRAAERYFEVGFRSHFLLFTVTPKVLEREDRVIRRTVDEVRTMIVTLEERPQGEQWVLEPQQNDIHTIKTQNKIVDEEMRRQGLASKEIASLDRLIQMKPWKIGDHDFWQAAGLKLGSLLRENIPGFHWVIIKDDEGRDPALRFGKTSVLVYPRSMLAKRLHEKESFTVKELFEQVIETVETMVRQGY